MNTQDNQNKDAENLNNFSESTYDYQNRVLVYHLLSHYASLLEYHLSTYPKAEQPIFDEAHYLLFKNKLGLVNQVIDKLDKTV